MKTIEVISCNQHEGAMDEFNRRSETVEERIRELKGKEKTLETETESKGGTRRKTDSTWS